jgi:hypothetical protein
MNRLQKILWTLLATLREIFDEAAYERFLERARLASSPQAYSEFLREREKMHSPRPRCC